MLARISLPSPSALRARPRKLTPPKRPAPQGQGKGFGAFVESAAQELLAVTYWFDPSPHRGNGAVSIRFSGRRIGAAAKPRPGDEFVHDETVDEVLAGNGPVSVTARIRGINPGQWNVSATVRSEHNARGPHRRATLASTSLALYPAGWSWPRWSLYKASTAPAKTCLAPLAQVPGVIPGVYALMVVLGIVTALVVQALIISREHLTLGPTLTVSLISIAAGVIGAKVWYVVLHRKERRFEGWCIQGFLLGVGLGAAVSLAAFHTTVGTFLDVASPGLFFGLAIGRIGCFFAGCCSGRPTTSRWGIWSSDQRVGMRRIPTQFLELGVALGIALAASAAVLTYGPMGGSIFVAALSAYTLLRQAILRLRVESRRSALGGPLTALAAALVLVGDAVILVLRTS